MKYKYEYNHFIPENVSLKGATKIIVKDSTGEQAGFISSGRFNKLSHPSGNPLYSFGVFSDVHINPIASSVAAVRFKNAVKYLADEEKVKFICIAGDLTGQGTEAQLREYIELVNTSKSLCTNQIEIHDTTGNHDVEQGFATKEYLQSYANGVEPYASRELYYSFTQGNDLFIMFGMTGWPGKSYNTTGLLFSDEQLDWLEQTLETNKNKRCFLFVHPPYFTAGTVNGKSVVTEVGSGSGVMIGLPAPTGTYISRWTADKFKTLLKTYTNVIYFHGHTHMEFFYQEDEPNINYCLENFDDSSVQGIHSIHIPSLAVGRELNSAGSGWGAPVDIRGGEGYLVDVYENHIVLRGRDFVSDKFVPIATYCLETK